MLFTLVFSLFNLVFMGPIDYVVPVPSVPVGAKIKSIYLLGHLQNAEVEASLHRRTPVGMGIADQTIGGISLIRGVNIPNDSSQVGLNSSNTTSLPMNEVIDGNSSYIVRLSGQASGGHFTLEGIGVILEK